MNQYCFVLHFSIFAHTYSRRATDLTCLPFLILGTTGELSLHCWQPVFCFYVMLSVVFVKQNEDIWDRNLIQKFFKGDVMDNFTAGSKIEKNITFLYFQFFHLNWSANPNSHV